MVDAQEVLDDAKAQRDREQNLLRPVAEFFHRHEGELFERYEAVDALIAADAVPATDERTLHRVVGNLCADRVDPVQNVIRDDEKYVGVLAYDEHEYWYEYTEVDDVHGRMNVGVCAQCVKDADTDAEVARGCGTTEDLSRRIRDHYVEEHSEDPDSVETGATLVSGTSIAGNTVIHSGNDGLGSGLDADTFRGSESNELVRPGIEYTFSEESGVVKTQFTSPSSSPQGVGIGSSDCIWHADNTADSIYQLNQAGIVQSQFLSPSSSPTGLGLDSNDCIWNADSTAQSIFQLNKTGTVQSQFASPSSSPQGLGLDSNNCIWHADNPANSIYQLNQAGTVQSQFPSPSSSPQGVGLDSNDCIWHADIDGDFMFQLNQIGIVQTQFPSPGGGAQGVGFDSNDCIWNADSNAESIYKLLANQVTLQ